MHESAMQRISFEPRAETSPLSMAIEFVATTVNEAREMIEIPIRAQTLELLAIASPIAVQVIVIM
jgi:hypothetical protein